MLLSAAEMPLAPLWVYLAFGEQPTRDAVFGGALVAGAILFDAIPLSTATRRARQTNAPDQLAGRSELP
jgi:drug/metabolite transporter (DMT)-like permease